MGLKAEDIGFWILILAAIFVLLWLLHGSPTLSNALITVGLFIIGSEFMLWRKAFDIDKRTTVGFVKVKGRLDNINARLDSIEGKLDLLIKRKR